MKKPSEAELVSAARRAMLQSYSPYSHIKVGAAILTVGAKVFTGCNVENVIFPATICAERSAIPAAILQGSRSIEAIVIVSNTKEPLLPCGICLQTISEFAKDKNIVILSIGTNGHKAKYKLGQLFPSGIRIRETIKSSKAS